MSERCRGRSGGGDVAGKYDVGLFVVEEVKEKEREREKQQQRQEMASPANIHGFPSF
jgi:hypothetical protein